MAQFYTELDHLQGTYINLNTGKQSSIEEKGVGFYTKIGDPKRELLSPFAEAVLVAQKIANTTKGKINVCISGGVDSECMLQSFIKAGVEFKPVILIFKNNLNDYDTSHAIESCKKYKIEYITIEIDLDDFYTSKEYNYICDTAKCRSPQLAVHLWLVMQLDGLTVFAWNPPRLKFDKEKIQLSLPSDLYFSYTRFSQKTGASVRPFFFLDNPEIFYSFFKLKFVKTLLSNTYDFNSKYCLDEYYLKCHMLRCGGFKFTDKRYKYTGFELYKKYLQKKLKINDEHIYTKLLRNPLESKYPGINYFLSDINLKFISSNNELKNLTGIRNYSWAPQKTIFVEEIH